MYDKVNDFYRGAIHSVVGDDVTNVALPAVHGTTSRIYIVEHRDATKTVFRFNNRQTAHRNHDMGLVLHAHGIPAPQTELHMYRGQYFETYPYLVGGTMAEHISNGMSPEKIRETYFKMAHTMQQIAKIPLRDLQNIENYKCHQVAQTNIVKKTNNQMVGALVKYGTIILNGGEQTLCHCDLTPQNIILDANGDISAILDLNAFSVGNINFSVAITGLGLERQKLDKQCFYDACRAVMREQFNEFHVRTVEKICRAYFKYYTKKR